MIAPRVLAVAVGIVVVGQVDAAVFCAKRRPDGTFSSAVRVREACRPSEATLTPDQVGFCCTTSTTTTTTFVLNPCPTTSTLPTCAGSPPSCGGGCPGGLTCTDDGTGHCSCLGPPVCGQGAFCGGGCPAGETCQPIAVPQGCSSIGCACQ